MFDVVVIGGGPAGLQATLTLARGQRRVALVDGGAPRNQRAVQVNNFVSRDGIPPKDFRAESRRQLEGYGVRLVQGLVRGVHGEPDGFTVDVDDDTRLEARRIVVALFRRFGHVIYVLRAHGDTLGCEDARAQRFAAALAMTLAGEPLEADLLDGLEKPKLVLLRNAIYVRHGRAFKSAKLTAFFYGPKRDKALSKLRVDTGFSQRKLTKADWANGKTVREVEKALRARPDCS